MNPLRLLAQWLDVRPAEYRAFALSATGAFLVIAFSVVSRSLREAFFIDEFSVEALPLMDLATVSLSLPAVMIFSRLLSRHDPDRIFRALIAALFVGLAVLGALSTWMRRLEIVELGGTIAFYALTAVGTLLLTSAFWVVTSEQFVLRDAKRLFGLIGAGGTLGLLVGLSVRPLTRAAGNGAPVVALLVCLVLLAAAHALLPPPRAMPARVADDSRGGTRRALSTVARNPHLRTLALIVAVATAVSFLVDYQFKAEAARVWTDDAELAGFLGNFYAITGIFALAVQVLAASRLLNRAGVAATLTVLPLVVALGSIAMLAVPGMAAATVARGGDNTLKKSLHRSVLEYLWVPVPAGDRRRTKTFVDSFIDSGALGITAAGVWVWVALGVPARLLSVPVILLSIGMVALARTMDRRYFQTLVEQLARGQGELEDSVVQTQFAGGEMTMTVTQFDIEAALTHTGTGQSQARHSRRAAASATGGASADAGVAPVASARGTDADPLDIGARLRSSIAEETATALEEEIEWGVEHVDDLVRLLPRDLLSERTTEILAKIGAEAIAPLRRLLLDENADFVIRRRVPRVLARIDEAAADRALLEGLSARRFEVRYRCAVALARRRREGRATVHTPEPIWSAVRAELGRERPIWELQRLLDAQPASDDFVAGRVYGRGELSLEHTFRLLSMVLDPDPIRTAFHGIMLDDAKLRSISLEYLEQVLPGDVRDRLWPFIGDISEHQRQQTLRGVDEVVADLLRTGATLFGGEDERTRLREALADHREENE